MASTGSIPINPYMNQFPSVTNGAFAGAAITTMVWFVHLILEKDKNTWRAFKSPFNFLVLYFHIMMVFVFSASSGRFAGLAILKPDLTSTMIGVVAQSQVPSSYALFVYLRTKAFVDGTKLAIPARVYVGVVLLIYIIQMILFMVSVNVPTTSAQLRDPIRNLTYTCGSLLFAYDFFTIYLTNSELRKIKTNINSPNAKAFGIIAWYSMLMAIAQVLFSIIFFINLQITGFWPTHVCLFLNNVAVVLTGYLMVTMKRILLDLQYNDTVNSGFDDSKIKSSASNKVGTSKFSAETKADEDV